MNRFIKLHHLLAATVLLALSHADSVSACAACYGKTDSQLAVGMNWGIMSLLVVVVGMLSAVGSFFIYLARKSAAVAASTAAAQSTSPSLTPSKA